MRVKEYSPTWPPDITVGIRKIPPKAGLSDIVLGVRKAPGNRLGLKLCREYDVKYEVVLPVPKSFQQKLIFSILRKKNTTLREVGDMNI